MFQVSDLSKELVSNLKSKWPSLAENQQSMLLPVPSTSNTTIEETPTVTPQPNKKVLQQSGFKCTKCTFEAMSQYHLDKHIKGIQKNLNIFAFFVISHH